ncbi:HD-GYP domain-containing protein [Chloroflexota bacterium]
MINFREPVLEKPKGILIVDSNDDIRKLLQAKLTSKGYTCYEALQTDQILSKLRNDGIALVILGTDSQRIPAAELVSTIKTNHPNTAIVVATPVGGTNIGIECKELGADEYITKPFIMEEVVLTVSKVLEKRQMETLKNKFQEQLQDIVGEQTEIIRNSFFHSITALVHALEAKDVYTCGHSQRVSGLSVAISDRMHLTEQSIEKIKTAGLVHDIGKIGIKELILNKPTSLTEEEYKQVQHHPEIGEYILAPIVNDIEILQLVKHHHEHYDGTGYPDQLISSQIPLGTRILAVADAYDAMTSDRSYRKAMSSQAAFAELESRKGTQFDPDVVNALLQITIREVSPIIVNSPVLNY